MTFLNVNMVIIVTGATGFIGRYFTREALAAGNDVYCLVRDKKKAHEVFAAERMPFLIEMPMEDYSRPIAEIKRADIFVHFAWSSTLKTLRNNGIAQNRNIEYCLDAVRLAARLGCRLFMGMGSQAEYGAYEGFAVEDMCCRPNTEYGKAKLEAGRSSALLCNALGMKYLHARIFSVFGPGDHENTLISQCLRNMRQNKDMELSACAHLWNFLHVKDAARQIYLLGCRALKDMQFSTDLFNVASKDTRVLRCFVEAIHVISRSSSNLLFGEKNDMPPVSLNPSVTKAENYINFISGSTFEEYITKMI